MAYWKLPKENTTGDEPRAMLVVLRMVETPSLEYSKYAFPEMAQPYPEAWFFRVSPRT